MSDLEDLIDEQFQRLYHLGKEIGRMFESLSEIERRVLGNRDAPARILPFKVLDGGNQIKGASHEPHITKDEV
jgi:hypothetical protein